jgi:hypothetical protein
MAATRVQQIPNPQNVSLSPAAGEFLSTSLTASGPIPKFRLASDLKGTLQHQDIFRTHPAARYEWTYLRDAADIEQFEILTLGLVFATNARYRYTVAVHGPAGPLRTVLDIEYIGATTDFDDESFRILIV